MVFEDEHLLLINKPPGISTHAPSPYGSEGIYDWLRHREPRWAKLSIIHRLDKDTSGLMVFGKTRQANQSLTRQFTDREVDKRYAFLTESRVEAEEFTRRSEIFRSGACYRSREWREGQPLAETKFSRVRKFKLSESGNTIFAQLWEARPATGRTHQIRLHAMEAGIPVLGDSLYDGPKHHRLCLHAQFLGFRHPETGERLEFTSEPDFGAFPRIALRRALVSNVETNAYRLVHGAADGCPENYVECLGDCLLWENGEGNVDQPAWLSQLADEMAASCVYRKTRLRSVRQTRVPEASPSLVSGKQRGGPFGIVENGVRYELSFQEGYSYGLFLDQRDNRRRLLRNHVAGGFPLFAESMTGRRVLNTFAYTCAFSVCAGLAGATTTSLDLSRKYLDWGRRNFALNNMNPDEHDFIFGDVFDWLKRFAKKGREFDVVLLDPPTFSKAKTTGVFRAEKDYGRLVSLAVKLVAKNGVMFVSSNAAKLDSEDFLNAVETGVTGEGRRIIERAYFPQPPDFPITRDEPGYLKTLWMRVD